MRGLSKTIYKHSPMTPILWFGVWSVVNGIGLMWPGSMFNVNKTWARLQAIHASDFEWGVLMFIIGVALIASLYIRSMALRSTICLFASVMWGLLGLSMVVSGYDYGIFSIIGLYSLWCAINAILAMSWWIYHEEDISRGDW